MAEQKFVSHGARPTRPGSNRWAERLPSRRTTAQRVAPEVNNYGFFCDFFKSWWMQQEAFGANPQ